MASYDINNEQGKVRLLISDIGGSDGSAFLFEDEEIQAFLDMEGSAYGAAAVALRTIAGNEAQVSKRIKFLELSTDGPAVAKSLLDLADKYQAKADDGVDTDEDFGFEIANMGADPFARREILRGDF